MNKTVFLLCISALLGGCAATRHVSTALGTGTSELTGISLFNDRRNATAILMDEKIEADALISLNLDSAIRDNCHFNVTSYNGVVLVTGETLDAFQLPRITALVQALDDVKFVKNETRLEAVSSFSSRANDSLITAKVKNAFTADDRLAGFDATRLKVVTENGRVFLMGMVYAKEGQVAAEIARQQSGVQEVIKVFEYL